MLRELIRDYRQRQKPTQEVDHALAMLRALAVPPPHELVQALWTECLERYTLPSSEAPIVHERLARSSLLAYNLFLIEIDSPPHAERGTHHVVRVTYPAITDVQNRGYTLVVRRSLLEYIRTHPEYADLQRRVSGATLRYSRT